MKDLKDLHFPPKTMNKIDSIFYIFFGLFPSSRSFFKTTEELNLTKLCWAYGLQIHNVIDSDGIIFDPIIDTGLERLFLLKTNQLNMPSFSQFMSLCWGEEEHEDENL